MTEAELKYVGCITSTVPAGYATLEVRLGGAHCWLKPGDVLMASAPDCKMRVGRLEVAGIVEDTTGLARLGVVGINATTSLAAITGLCAGDSLYQVVGDVAKIASTRDVRRLAGGMQPQQVDAEPAPVPAIFQSVGTWRIYFNRMGAAPLHWCVSPALPTSWTGPAPLPEWELAIRGLELGVPSRTVFSPKPTPDHEDGHPSAWVEATGRLVMLGDGRIRIEAA